MIGGRGQVLPTFSRRCPGVPLAAKSVLDLRLKERSQPVDNPKFEKLRSILLNEVKSTLGSHTINSALLASPMLTPGEMLIMHRLGDVAVLLKSELAECFAQGGDARG